MKQATLLGIVLAAAVSLPAVAAEPVGGTNVTIELSGVRAGTGDLYVSLQTRDQFMKDDGSYGEIIVGPAAGARTVTLPGVAAGTYAASVWHDINGNRRFDADEQGKPLDGWAMLNGEKLRAEPKFDQVSFGVGSEPKTLKLAMRYGF